MNDKEAGSSLIWFVSLLALTVLILLTLVSSMHQFLFARKLHDYTEQVALAGKTWLLQGVDLGTLEAKLDQLPSFPSFLTKRKIDYLDGKTLEVELCSTWVSPITLITASAEMCESAKAR